MGIRHAMKNIHVALTLDCERPNSETDPTASGPPSYAAGIDSTQGYVKIAEARGYPVTLFVHPEAATADPSVFKQFEADGHNLGLHLHPWRFADLKYAAELGALSDNDARAVISEATSMWQSALGYRPKIFRSGAASANDSTFRILSELGFEGGSSTIPGRVYPDIYAIWAGSDPDPHRANAVFRQLPGQLEFAEVPISVDSSRQVHKNGRSFHWELRPDWDVEYDEIAFNIVGQVIARAPDVPVINMVTHNDHNFADPDDPFTVSFSSIIDAIEAACERSHLTPIGSTVQDIVDLTLALPHKSVELNKASGKVIQEAGEFIELDMAGLK